MTTKTIKITIDAHEDKTSKNGKDYTRYSTNKGWMSCFESDVNKELKLLPEGNSIEVEFRESEYNGKPQYAIQTCHPSTANATPAMNTELPVAVETKNTIAKHTMPKDPVGLAVEVFIAIVDKEQNMQEKQMSYAIQLVKQAQEAFN